MSASNSSGIQTLLEAERKAQETVQEARAFRSQRLKASKADAAKEIEEYQKTKENEFYSASSKSENEGSQAESTADRNAQKDIDALKTSAEKGRAGVIQYLVEQTTTV